MSRGNEKIKALINALNLVFCEIFQLVAGNSVCENKNGLTLYRCDVAALGYCIWRMIESSNNYIYKVSADKFLNYIKDSPEDSEKEWSEVLVTARVSGRLQQFCENTYTYGSFRVFQQDMASGSFVNAMEILGRRCANYANALYLMINTVALHTLMNTCPAKRQETYFKLLMCAFRHNGLGKYYKNESLSKLLEDSKKNIVKIERKVYEPLKDGEGFVEARLFDIFGRAYHLARTCATLSSSRTSAIFSEYKPGIVLWNLLLAEENTSDSLNSIGDMLENFYVILERVCSTEKYYGKTV